MLLLWLFKNERLKKKKKQYLKLLLPTVRGPSALPFLFFKKLNFCCSQRHEITLIPLPRKITLTFRHHLQRCSNHNQNSQIQCSQILLEPMVVIALWHIPIFIVCCAGVMEMMWILPSLIGRNFPKISTRPGIEPCWFGPANRTPLIYILQSTLCSEI